MNPLQPGSHRRIAIVVPCFNEAERIDVDRFSDFAARHPDFSFLFVNDGSNDRTQEILKKLQAQNSGWCELLDLKVNRGKGEAVRRGMIQSYASRPAAIGYLDADLATPLEALPRMVDALGRRPQTHLVMGTRLRLQGHQIERTWVRRVLGRSFALVASWTLGLAIVDTQCGAKLFRASPHIEALFSEPFRSRWIFDVEILARLYQHLGRQRAAEQLYELPLETWCEISGSKLKSSDFVRAVGELAGNLWQYRLRPGLLGRASAASGGSQATMSPEIGQDDGEDRRAA